MLYKHNSYGKGKKEKLRTAFMWSRETCSSTQNNEEGSLKKLPFPSPFQSALLTNCTTNPFQGNLWLPDMVFIAYKCVFELGAI